LAANHTRHDQDDIRLESPVPAPLENGNKTVLFVIISDEETSERGKRMITYINKQLS